MRTSLLFSVFVAVAAFSGCSKDNPNFCQGPDCSAIDAPIDSPPVNCDTNGPDPSCPASNPICVDGECTGMCTDDAHCATRPAGERICLVSSGACVECDENNEQADPPGGAEDECPDPGTAVCDGTTHTCDPCEAHSECAAGICDDGRCAPEAEIVFMSPTGSDGGTCGARTAPCLTLNEAVDRVQAAPTEKHYIFMAPSATPYTTRNNNDNADFDNVDVFVVGYGAVVNRSGMGEVVRIRGGSNVRIEGLEISNATGIGIGIGVILEASTLELFDASVQNNAARGIVAQSTPTLTIARSRIINNDAGGISLDGGTFDIVNSVIARNGDSTSAFGGVSLAPSGAVNFLQFNTFVNNSAGAAIADNIICSSATAVVRNNIVVGLIPLQPRVSGACAHSHSLFTPDGAPNGTNNMNVADANMYMFTADFHIGASSIALGRADSTNMSGELLFDIDGDGRTAGGTTVDVGADEIQ